MRITNRYVVIAIITAFVVGVWNLVDYLVCSLIWDREYAFSVWTDLLLPAAVGCIFGITVFYLRDRLRRG
ncbi:MAG: hypothetical protein II049_03470 [Clostridia bacterium]|jgi:hypothetical protein|nr:hypothetical protein [Clostridia bacterium]